MPRPIASWNPERDVWESEAMDLFSGLSDVYSETFPSSGSMRNGSVYARPTSAPLTDASGSSSSPGLLPTPTTLDHVEKRTMHAGGNLTLQGSVAGVNPKDATRLLPTPRTTDGNGAGSHGQGGMDLRTTVTLLPTPAAGNFNDGESVESWEARRQRNLEKGINGNGQGTPLGMAVRMLPGVDTSQPSDGGKAS